MYHFTKKDFNVFEIDGLENRMAALIETTRPKLENLGEYFSDFLTAHTGETYYPHVAKHLRRTTNPPNDTWVAFSTHKRGYKMLPHFQIGLFGSHVFVLYGVIYESPEKDKTAETFLKKEKTILALEDFIMRRDHMKEASEAIEEEALHDNILRLKNVKKGELLFGKIYEPGHPALKSDKVFLKEVEDTFLKLIELT
ncbi:DUF1054 family protein [Macrococcus brunensis]|uniref:DUF1054 family protein n=1 Tax=Macrococcus brunensis TaxID=198483 RepID=UPI001EF02387|nr:DUF1054 family protein [Macrococcus brunensis]ULG75007.1 DUF1054 domain-containing protein [Macrococcus brunensis]